MNVDDVAVLVAAGLDAAGYAWEVLDPVTAISAIPVVALAPADDEVDESGRYMTHGVDVVVIVPRNNQTAWYRDLQSATAAIVAGLAGSSVSIDGPIGFASTGGGTTGEPPALTRTIPVTYIGDADLCPTPT